MVCPWFVLNAVLLNAVLLNAVLINVVRSSRAAITSAARRQVAIGYGAWKLARTTAQEDRITIARTAAQEDRTTIARTAGRESHTT